jgi:undecaprenyl-diphosphatase
MKWDWSLFRLINGWAGHWPLLDGFMRLLVSDYGLTTAMGLGLVALWFEGRHRTTRERNQRAVLMAVFALLLASVLLKLCNLVYHRPRPFYSHPVNLLFYYPSDSSLPSNSATVGFSLAASVWLQNRRFGLGFGLGALVFGFSRVFCGVHYPGDILGGALLGGGVAYVLFRQGRRLDPLVDFIFRIARCVYLA